MPFHNPPNTGSATIGTATSTIDPLNLQLIEPGPLLDAGIPGGLSLSSFANDAFAQAIQLFATGLPGTLRWCCVRGRS